MLPSLKNTLKTSGLLPTPQSSVFLSCLQGVIASEEEDLPIAVEETYSGAA